MACADLPLTELARRCLESGDSEAWEELIGRLQPVFARAVYRVTSRWGYANLKDIDDIIQEAFFKLAARRADLSRLPEESEEAAYAYFKVMAANCAHDYLRSKFADKRGESKTEQLEPRLDQLSSAAGLRAMNAAILISQVDAALDAGPRDRSVFWLYYQQGFTAKEIAAILGNQLSDKGVESLIHRLTASVRDTLKSPKGSSGARPS